MADLKINILFRFHEGAWGGGNQFLKALKKEFMEKGIYEKDPRKANCILFNSHHNIMDVMKLKRKCKNKIFIHRIDGPLFLLRQTNPKDDLMIYSANNLIADGTIFQSQWSRKKNYALGLKKNNFETVLMNSVDKDIFFPLKRKECEFDKTKCNLIATSWSPSPTKGFDLYNYLDSNLDFEKYSMTFVGNSPIQFNRITHIKPVPSKELANLLRESDIYITGSRNDPCSNSLIEALSCGLPCVALNGGGHPELLKKGGETFNKFEECLIKIDQVRDNYKSYRNNIETPTLEEVMSHYKDFMFMIYSKSEKNYYVKRFSLIKFILEMLKIELILFKSFKSFIKGIYNLFLSIKNLINKKSVM